MFSVSSTLCGGLVSICVLCPFYAVMWVGWCKVFFSPFYTVLWVGGYLFSVSLLHCYVGWSVFVFWVPSTLCCGLFVFCVPFTLCCGLVDVFFLCPFFTVLRVGQCFYSMYLVHCFVYGSVFVFCVPSTLCCWLVI